MSYTALEKFRQGVLLAASFCVGTFWSLQAWSVPDGKAENLLDLSLTELMDLPVDTAGYFSSSWRAQPGVITVFSSSDIQAMGARTLRDVLLHIPGASLGMDNHNAVNLILRGNWAHEGKIQYLVNDIPVNDIIFGTFPIPPYMPADQLDRVEIMRGSGSVKYGDSAQLAVIRIYTRDKDENARISFTAMDESGAKTGILNFNDRVKYEHGSLSVAGSINSGRWGSGTWVDDVGTNVDVSTIATTGSNLAANGDWMGTKFQLYYTNYFMDGVQYFGTYDAGRTVAFKQMNVAVSHDFELDNTWTLRPRVSFHSEHSWQSADPMVSYDIPGERLDARLDATNRYASDASVAFGIYHQLLKDQAVGAQQGVPANVWLAPNGGSTYSESALYGNWDWTIHDYNLSIGGRLSNHQYDGTTFTPQFGLTRSTPEWHFKALYGTASRDPNLEQINPTNHPNQDTLKPEFTTVNELEFGHVLTNRSYVTFSVFDQSIRNAIVYLPNPGGFTNNPPSNTRGIEAQYWYRGEQVTVQGNYSYARANDYDIPLYNSLLNGQNLGAAKQIANLWSEWHTPVPHLSLLADVRYLGTRAAYAYSQTTGIYGQQILGAEKTLNLGLRYNLRSAILSAGVYNVGNEKQFIPQPYDATVPAQGGQPAVPGSTPFPVGARELWLRVEWQFSR